MHQLESVSIHAFSWPNSWWEVIPSTVIRLNTNSYLLNTPRLRKYAAFCKLKDPKFTRILCFRHIITLSQRKTHVISLNRSIQCLRWLANWFTSLLLTNISTCFGTKIRSPSRSSLRSSLSGPLTRRKCLMKTSQCLRTNWTRRKK